MTAAPAVPVAPLVALGALVGGILGGEAAGPADATGVLVAGVIGVVAALCVRAGVVRTAVVALGLALLGAAVMQRSLHGIAVSPLVAAVTTHADARVAATLVDDPDASRFDTRVLVRVDALVTIAPARAVVT